MIPSMMPHQPLSRIGMTHVAPVHTEMHADRQTLQGRAQGKRQLKRLHWAMFIASMALLVNMLATVAGLWNPLYEDSHPAATPNATHSTVTGRP